MPRSSDIRSRYISTGSDGIEYRDTFWNDIRFSAIRIRQGATSKPDFDATDLGLLFPEGDAAEIAYISEQMPHDWKVGTSVYPHIHYIQDEAQEPVFKIDYRFHENGSLETSGFTTLTASTFVFPYSSGVLVQIVAFPAIDLSAFGLSALFDFKLYRDDSAVSGDVLVKSFDIHYEIDSPGSRQAFIK